MTVRGDAVPLNKHDDAYTVWRFAIAAVAELLLLTNTDEQLVMADVAGPEDWGHNAITIFAGCESAGDHYRKNFGPRLRIGDMSVLRVWDGQLDARALDASRTWDTLWPDMQSKEPFAVAERLARHLGFSPQLPKVGAVERSWGEVWARMFAASVDALQRIDCDLPWVLQTSYREGAGHYIHVDPCGILFQGFYLNQAGYISCNRDDGNTVVDREALNTFDIRRVIESGASRDETSKALLSVIQQMIERIESHGFDSRYSSVSAN